MPSIRSHVVRFLIVKHYMKKVFDLEKQTVEQMRRKFINLAKRTPLPKGTTVEKTTVAGMPAEWVRSANVPQKSQKTILHFHGGGNCGSCDTHRSMAAMISKACGVRVLIAEYRLAPENKYPAANDDCLSFYQWLIEQGVSPKSIVIGGDSFGAGLALMSLLSLRDTGRPLPAAAYLFSPWDFVRFDGESYNSRAKLDPMTTRESYIMCGRSYVDPSNPKPVSLIDRDLTGLPDLLIQTGDHEVILSDSNRIAEHAKNTGVNVILKVWDNMWHGFQGFAAIVPEAKQALENVGTFVRSHLNDK